MREGRIIQFQREGVWSEEELTKSRAETVLEWPAGPVLRAGHLRIISRTHNDPLSPGTFRPGIICDVAGVWVGSGKSW